MMSSSAARVRDRRIDPRIEQTQRLVKAATLELIAEVGFEGTTIESISERSGVSRSTIYRHWPNPSDLYLQAFDPSEDEQEPPELTGDLRADLRAFVHHVADRLNDERFAAALTAQIDKGRRDPAYREAQLAYAFERNERGAKIIRAGVAQGVFRADLDPAYETEVVLSQLVYRRLMRYRVIDRELIDRIVAETWTRLVTQ
jgi:TetR/AcrR family transcriptional regulator of autoinduction and epiphytic fitness